jgi:hypothetical protein
MNSQKKLRQLFVREYGVTCLKRNKLAHANHFVSLVIVFSSSFLFSGCPKLNQPLTPHQPYYNGTTALIWTQDESKVISIIDSTPYCITEVLSNNGTVIKRYPALNFNVNAVSDVWSVGDDSSMILQMDAGLVLFHALTGTWDTLSTEYTVVAQSPDLRHFILAPTSYGTVLLGLRSAELVGNSLRDIRDWGQGAPEASFELWSGSNSIGYFRYNSSHLIDFLLVDTNLVPQDSIAPGLFADVVYTQVLHAPGKFYFASSAGIMAVDSASHAINWLSHANSTGCEMTLDGSMIVCDSATGPYESQPHLLNTKTGAAKGLAINPFRFFLSPRGDLLATIIQDSQTPLHVTIQPVSPP